jgi:hypothetical protein
MFRRNRVPLIIATVLMIVEPQSIAQHSPATPSYRSLIQTLGATGMTASEVRNAAVEEAITLGDSVVPNLLAEAESPTVSSGDATRQQQVSLCQIFGRLRTEKAIPFLIRNAHIDETWETYKRKSKDSQLKALPCASALVQIGDRVAAEIVEVLEGQSPERIRSWRHLYSLVLVLTSIDSSMGRDYLRILSIDFEDLLAVSRQTESGKVKTEEK